MTVWEHNTGSSQMTSKATTTKPGYTINLRTPRLRNPNNLVQLNGAARKQALLFNWRIGFATKTSEWK